MTLGETWSAYTTTINMISLIKHERASETIQEGCVCLDLAFVWKSHQTLCTVQTYSQPRVQIPGKGMADGSLRDQRCHLRTIQPHTVTQFVIDASWLIFSCTTCQTHTVPFTHKDASEQMNAPGREEDKHPFNSSSFHNIFSI